MILQKRQQICVHNFVFIQRPYHISSNTNLPDVIQMFESSCLMFPSSWSKNFKDLLKKVNVFSSICTDICNKWGGGGAKAC